jgi:hypothetical protein
MAKKAATRKTTKKATTAKKQTSGKKKQKAKSRIAFVGDKDAKDRPD